MAQCHQSFVQGRLAGAEDRGHVEVTRSFFWLWGQEGWAKHDHVLFFCQLNAVFSVERRMCQGGKLGFFSFMEFVPWGKGDAVQFAK